LFSPEYVPYEKALYVDTDTGLSMRLIDGVFEDPGTAPRKSLTDPDLIRNDESEIPSSYIFAAVSETTNNTCILFVICCMRYLTSTPDSSSTLHLTCYSIIICLSSKTQIGLWTRWFLARLCSTTLTDGRVRCHGAALTSWSVLWPNKNELKGGLAALHAKWWKKGEGINRAVSKFCPRKQWEMSGYWTGRSENGAK
jgi:hypothetical protein